MNPGRDVVRRDAREHDVLASQECATAPIFTPPWNRCTRTTGRCLVDLGFRALVRDSSAAPLELDGLQELDVHVDWSARRKGQRVGRVQVGALLAAACRRGPTGVMLHHALLGREERDGRRAAPRPPRRPRERSLRSAELTRRRVTPSGRPVPATQPDVWPVLRSASAFKCPSPDSRPRFSVLRIIPGNIRANGPPNDSSVSTWVPPCRGSNRHT